MKFLHIGFVLIAAIFLSACGEEEEPQVVMASTTNPANQLVVLSGDAWTIVQEVTITVDRPGQVFLSATGGKPEEESCEGLCPVAWLGIGNNGATEPTAISTVQSTVSAFEYEQYRVLAYAVSQVYPVDETGTFAYVLDATGVEDPRGRPVTVQPNILVALFSANTARVD